MSVSAGFQDKRLEMLYFRIGSTKGDIREPAGLNYSLCPIRSPIMSLTSCSIFQSINESEEGVRERFISRFSEPVHEWF
jgi:hypothetical protein